MELASCQFATITDAIALYFNSASTIMRLTFGHATRTHSASTLTLQPWPIGHATRTTN
ncbi:MULTISPECIES: hypothetical protein [unclassified Moorena]|uniref:hypothetical protein n=1 Tax=unclassified Moorena TaxID=2683338 RepID=UPI0013BEBF17|nr:MULTISPECIES: hypothetical protein [unclassified Moorena]NEO04975.1 hypothetical protein [Moorena sp. SIO3I8]NEO18676.1 hypothetical protein [Moorena sp. SIO4A5]NEQ56077.1 hypothetical protein [Moorena sp. SIO4A1]